MGLCFGWYHCVVDYLGNIGRHNEKEVIALFVVVSYQKRETKSKQN